MPMIQGRKTRDRLKTGEPRDVVVTFRLSKRQRDIIDAAAELNGLTRAHLVAKAIGPGLRALAAEGKIK